MAATPTLPDFDLSAPLTALPAAPRTVPARSIRRRKRLERLTYGAAALGLAIGPHTGYWPVHLGAAALGTLTVRWLWRKWDMEPRGWNFLQAAQRALPVLTGAAAYLTPLIVPGGPWWEWLLAPAWGTAMTLTTPLTHSARLTPEHFVLDVPAPLSAPAAPAVQAPDSYPAYRAHQWDTAKTTGTTRLTGVTQYDNPQGGGLLPDFWGIVIAEAGDAVPDLNATTLAAVFDLPPGTVTLSLIQGSGPGRKLLMARPTLDALEQVHTDPVHRIFTERLARPNGGATGMLLVDYRQEPNRIALRVTAPDDEMIQLNQKQIARSIGYKDASLVMVETDGLGDGLISLYKKHPLTSVREATADDLTMRADGTIQIGLRPDGRPARMQLYDPQLGALTDLFVGAMGAGKSVTLNTVLAAERISGVVSLVADAQNGMSLPEADGRVYHFGKGIAALAATLAAGYEVAQYREKVSSDNGWAGFELNDPWPLANLTLDELNRILSEDALVPRDFKKWVVGLVGDFQSTGRKFGMGIRFAAQSIHLADLGHKGKIRANAKNGTVWLGRTNSSTTQHMATDGVIPPGVTLEPIAQHFQAGNSIDDAFTGAEARKGPRTAGMANIIQGGSVFLARTFNARKENKTYPGLIKLYESAPIPALTPPENDVFLAAYARWLPYAEQLLAGEDETSSESAEAYALLEDDADDTPPTGKIKDRILALLADGQPRPIRDIRRRLDGVAPASVNNAVGELHQAGDLTALRRGTYQITPN